MLFAKPAFLNIRSNSAKVYASPLGVPDQHRQAESGNTLWRYAIIVWHKFERHRAPPFRKSSMNFSQQLLVCGGSK